MHPLISRIVSALDVRNVLAGDARAIYDELSSELGGSKSSGSQSGGVLISAIELEARVLYSASPLEFDSQQTEIQADLDFSTVEDSFFDSGQAAFSDFGLSNSSEDVGSFEFDLDLFNGPSASDLQHDVVTRELVFIDANVENWQALLDDITSTASDNVSVVLLDADRDGVEQISETLAEYDDLSAIHLISHGNQAQLNLGSTTLSNQNLAGYAGQIANWQGSLAENADLLIYGCDLAASDSGQELLESIGALCDCDVAASDDITGHETLGGDWDLEFSTGSIEHDTVISAAAQNDWVNRLAVYTVTSTLDDGSVGTLRWAIDSANSNGGVDNIEFNIAGSGVQRIDMTGDRYQITEAVIIDATTQSGYTFDTPMIEIDGTNATGIERDIFWITGGGTTVRGMSLINAGDDAIDIEFGDGNTIAGNFIGVEADGTTAASNRWGLAIKTNGNTIGGVTPADRNIISGNTESGVILHESNDNGAYLPATGNVFQGNWIGVDANGDAMGNTFHGIRLTEGTANTVIGGTSTGQANIIAFQGLDGVRMTGAGDGNSVRGNQFFGNGGLAIDLDTNGVTANDYNTINDGDSGSNGRQNFPDISTVVHDGSQLTITGDVTGRDNVDYAVDFYASTSVDGSGHGEAERYLGSTTVTTDAAGFQTFSVNLDVSVSAGEFVTATATHSDGSTSEFSLSVAAAYQPTGELWFSTDGSGPSWTDSEVVQFGDSGDSFDINAGLTNGSFSKLAGFDAPANIRAMHYVESHVQIGDPPNHFNVEPGDLVLSFRTLVDLNAGQANEFAATNKDIVVYRPGSGNDYSSGEYLMLLQNDISPASGIPQNIHGLALVEVDTTVGGTLLEAGTFLIAHSNPDHEDIATVRLTAAGAGGAAETIVSFLDGSDLGNADTHIQGLHLLQQDTYFNGSVLTAGSLLVQVNDTGTYAGVAHAAHDVIAITVSANEQNSVTSAATGALLFDGSDMGLTGLTERINGLTLVSSGFQSDDFSANADSIGISENQAISDFNVLDNDELAESDDLPEDPRFIFDANGEDVGDNVWEEDEGTGYDLTINPGVTFVNNPLNAPAQITAAFDLNGAGMTNSTSLSSLPSDPTQSPASFEFWIKPDDGSGQEIIFDAGNAFIGASLKLNDSSLEFTTNLIIPLVITDSMTVSADLSSMIAAQEYIHVVGVIDFSGSASMELFVNGVSAGTDSSANIVDWAGDFEGVGIGIVEGASVSTTSLGSDPFNGQIAAFNFHESALTDAQVLASYDSAFQLLTVQSHDAFSAQGIAVSIATDGTVTYNPGTTFDYLLAGETTTDTFNYVATNGDGETDSAQVTVTITGQNSTPVIADQDFLIAENLANGSAVATIIANDDDSGVEGDLSYLVTGGTGAAAFNVSSAGQITVNDGSLLDYETSTSLTLEVQVSDGGTPALTDTATITINLSDVNEAPSVVLSAQLAGLSENSNTASNVKVADIVVGDDALGSETLSLSGSDAGDFVIIGNELFLRAGATLDFESKTFFDVTVEVDDPTAGIGSGADDTVDYTLNIIDFNEAPTVSLTNRINNLSENTDTSSNVKIADIVVTDDALGSETLLLSGADAGDFVIVGNELFLRAGTSLDYETKTSFNLTVEVDDTTIGVGSENTFSHSFTITDLNEAPTVALANETFNLLENTDASSNVKVADIVVTDDALGSETLSLSGTDAGDFVIVGNELFLRAGTSLDVDTKPSFDVTVEVDDTTIGAGPEDSASYTLGIMGVNETPTIDTPIGSVTVDEDAVDTVLDLTSVFGDVDSASLTYSLVGNDNLTMVDAAVSGDFLTLDYLQDEFGIATVSVSATDGEFTVTDTFTVNVNAVNDAPVVLANGSLPVTLQNNFDPPGDSVDNLYGSLVSDVDPTSSLSGVAIVSNSANALTEGDWQYSTDSGVNWHSVGVVNDGLTALSLNANSLIRFVPVNNFVGVPASLEVRVLDDTFSGGFTVGVARTNFDSLDNGGATAVSAQTSTLTTEVATHGVIVTPISSVTDESGGTASFEVILLGAPTSTVSIAVASDNMLEGTTSTNVLTFDATNWNVAQTVIVTGVDDRDIDGDANYTIVLDAAVSADAGYGGLEVDDVSISNLDNDDARVIVSESSVTTNENGRTATFAVMLSSRPTADVTFNVASDNLTEGVVSTSSLTFNSTNWNVAQTVSVTGQADAVLDGNTSFQIVLSPTVSGDSNFNNLDPNDVNVVNLDVVPLVPTSSRLDSASEKESESESEASEDETDSSEKPDTIGSGGNKASSLSDEVAQAQPETIQSLSSVDAIGQQQEVVDIESDSPAAAFWFSTDKPTSAEKRAVEQLSLPALAPTYQSVLSSVDLWNDLDDLKEQMQSDVMMPTIVVGSAASAASVFTVGYVTWLIRGGQILMGVMARMPAWKLIDPLPILAALDSVDANAEDDSLASMVDNSNEKVTTESASQDADPDLFETNSDIPQTVTTK